MAAVAEQARRHFSKKVITLKRKKKKNTTNQQQGAEIAILTKTTLKLKSRLLGNYFMYCLSYKFSHETSVRMEEPLLWNV